MEVKSKFEEKLAEAVEEGLIHTHVAHLMHGFYSTFVTSMKGEISDHSEKVMLNFIEYVEEQTRYPYRFELFHRAIPDYHRFGIEFFKPLVDIPNSTIKGKKNLEKIHDQLEMGDNVIFLSNHQIEGDPQMLQILFEEPYPKLEKEMIFVAGHRVTTDPVAVPFSIGCNLLCIYSKRHIDHPPEKKTEKQLHNQKTMKVMGELLQEGGHCIYVAPSGGRDRMGADGTIQVAEFDAQSVEMFHFMAKRSKRPTHFYPLALSTYHILPPPKTVEKKIGEERIVGSGPIHIEVCDELDMDNTPPEKMGDKHLQRKEKARYIHSIVSNAYKGLIHEIN